MAEFVIKISEDYQDETLEAQFINPDDLTYTEELFDTNDLEFTLDISDPQIVSIIEYKKVAMYEITGNEDTLIWTGYISNPSNDFEHMFVICSDEKRYMQKKVIYEEKTYTSELIANILDELVTEANTRSGGLHGNLTYETSLTNTVTKTYTKGTTYFDILQDLAEELSAEWRVEKNNIIFETTIGADKTSGTDIVEFISNRINPVENSIAGYKSQRNGNFISTAVIGKNDTGYSEQEDNTSTFGFVESSISLTEGDIVDQTTEYLEEHKKSQAEIELIINPNKIDFRDINIGDLVQIKINHDNAFIDIDSSTQILEKIVEVKNKVPIISVKVGVVKKRVLTPQNFLAKLDRRIKTLELK